VKNAVRLTLITILFFGSASWAQGPSCKALFEKASILLDATQPLPAQISIAEMQKQNPDIKIYPDFTEANADRLLFHAQKVDFISLGERVLFLVANPDSAMSWGILNGTEPRIRIKELPGVTAFDITNSSLVTPLIRKSMTELAWFTGPNCWNLCQIYKGWAKTSFFTSEREFHLWIEGPFAKLLDRKAPGFTLKTGHLVVLRQVRGAAVKEIHGAVALTDKIVLTKNGKHELEAYELMTLDKMLNIYSSFSRANTMQIFDFTPFDEAWAQWKPRISPTLVQYMEEWLSFEQHHGEQYLPKKTKGVIPYEEKKKLRKEHDALVAKIKPMIEPTIEKMGHRNLSEVGEVELFFLKLLQTRVNNKFYFTGTDKNEFDLLYLLP
jgi:hypothetical protein